MTVSTGPKPITRYVSVVARAVRLALAGRFRSLGLGAGTYPLLFALLEGDDCSQDELAARVFMDKGAAARGLASLEADGFIRREAVAGNRRMNRIRLTDKGRGLADKLFAGSTEVNAELLEGFAPAEVQHLRRMLARIEDNARRKLAACQICGTTSHRR